MTFPATESRSGIGESEASRQIPVGTLLKQPPARRSRLRALIQWRNWSLPVKLAAVTLVPIIIALALGVTTIGNQVERADTFRRIDRLVTLGGDLRTLLSGVQRERTLTAQMLTEGSTIVPAELVAARESVDRAIPSLTAAASAAVELEPGIGGPNRETGAQLSRLASIRTEVGAGQLDPVQAVDEYSSINAALLKLDTALAVGVSDDAIGGTPNALHDLQIAGEELSVAQAIVSYGIDRGSLSPTELTRVRTTELRLSDRFADFRAAASQDQRQDFDSTVAGPNLDTRTGLVKTVLDEQGSGIASISAENWSTSSTAVLARVDEVGARLGIQLSAASSGLLEQASSGAGTLAVLLFGALVLTAAVVFLITRQLLRSLRVLRAGALDIAERQLPGAVRHIQDGRPQGTAVQPIAVNTDDEVGEVARAFDEVHSQALRLAVEQAALRTSYSAMFVNLSRRSQSLVQRQLQMIERLERDEEDADQLSTLFQLDHLATRMRRNNENLMVLSGSEPGRRTGQPVTTTDVLRAAVSEIEQYQRVTVQPPPPAKVVGYAASDLMRLLAELLDNATAFSAPETMVTVSTRFDADKAISIDILDSGIGMNDAEVAEANARLAEAASLDLATSRRMGLFVVGRLASRHGISVRLHGGQDISGVRATVTIPAELVLDDFGQEPPRRRTVSLGPSLPVPPQAPPPPRPPQSAPFPAPNGSLPRRPRGNGADRSTVLSNLANGGPDVPVPAQGSPLERRPFASGGDAPSTNGNGRSKPPNPGPPTVEISGTALFSPIRDHDRPGDAEDPGVMDRGAVDRGAADRNSVDRDVRPAEPETPRPRSAESRPSTAAESPAEMTLPGGSALFRAENATLSEWWRQGGEAPSAAPRGRAASAAPATPVPPPTPAETTPIFDEMLSAWFRSEPAPVTTEGAAAGAEQASASSWDFAADERQRAVNALSKVEPESFTEAGLPRRRKGEQLLPGSAASSVPGRSRGSDLPVRDPADVRGRLSSFQQGVSRGRKANRHEANGSAAESERTPRPQPHPHPQPRSAARRPVPTPESRRPARSQEGATAYPAASGAENRSNGDDHGTEIFERVEVTGTESPGTRGSENGNGAPKPGSGHESVPVERESSAWSFSTDENWQTVRAATQSAPAELTAAGLPRRNRGERLLPGSAGPPAQPAPRVERDPSDVRGRLSSFQQGVRRGRHRTTQATDVNHENMEGE